MGPVIRADSRARIHALVGQGLDEGAVMLRDGRTKVPAKGFFVGPTLIEIQPDSVLAGEELFGPVLSVIRADSIDDAIRLVTDTNDYGNASSIFTSSGRAAREFKRRNPAGMIGINVGRRGAGGLLPVQRPPQLVLRRPARHGPRRRGVLHDQEDDDDALVLSWSEQPARRARPPVIPPHG